jgi:hypothetical protein
VKKKFYLLLAFVLALILTGGVFAFTFTTAGATIPVAQPTGNIATVNATATQPNWESILTPVPAMNETFSPNGPGDETNIDTQQPTSGQHWDKVDDITPDEGGTHVLTANWDWLSDLYNIPEHVLGEGDINYVKVYFRCKTTQTGQTNARARIKSVGVAWNGAEVTTITSYVTYSQQWNANPSTGQAWTWADIDTLQIGVGLRRPAAGSGRSTYCTQVYVEVNYSGGIPLRGNVPTGNLSTVTPHSSYSGDLAVKVYLVNSGNLTKAYRYLDIKLYLEGSVEAGKTPNYQVLSLDNGVATFSLENSPGISRTLSVTGGGYGLNSKNPLDWEAGWTVTPEFYCEVTQR